MDKKNIEEIKMSLKMAISILQVELKYCEESSTYPLSDSLESVKNAKVFVKEAEKLLSVPK